MKTGTCRCGNRIFFNNHLCLSCQAPVGRCDLCGDLTSITEGDGIWNCDSCGADVYPCRNQKHGVCHSFHRVGDELCRWCQFTSVIPSLDSPEKTRRWATTEIAKRRLLLQLRQLELPPFVGNVQETHSLTFQFLEDQPGDQAQSQPVTTGHAEGVITINLAEADSIHREQQRVRLGEPQRTLIGHMRHEVGHYIDWSWASRFSPESYHRLFGDPESLDYRESMQRHYEKGAPGDWASNHVSAYATMHPWEDFAETVNAYLDIMAIATTANELGGHDLDLTPQADPQELINRVLAIVIEVSEYNFDLGLAPLLPERFPPVVLEKLSYIHCLRSDVLARNATGPSG